MRTTSAPARETDPRRKSDSFSTEFDSPSGRRNEPRTLKARKTSGRKVSVVTVAQNWTMIDFMAASLTALITVVTALITVMWRSMNLQGQRMEDGLSHQSKRMEEGFTSLRSEMHTALGGLRYEMNARFDSVDQRLGSLETKAGILDREVHALTSKAFGGEPPDSG